MSRKFNGTTDHASRALDLSAFSLVTMGFWLWWDAFANTDNLAFEFGTTNYAAGNGFLIDPNSGTPATGKFQIAMGLSTGLISWADSFTRPSAAAWHHYTMIFNRATPLNTVYVDGAPQTLTTVTHNAGTYGNFGSGSTLNFMCRNGASLFGAGRQADVAIWGGVALTAGEAKALAVGASPRTVHPDGIVFHPPLYGADSPEPDYSGKQRSVTLSGTSWAAHPGVMPGFTLPQRGFQPQPV